MPRDITRIYPFCNRLAALWSQYPDLRFGQLMHNVAVYADANYNKDIFYIEEAELLQIITEYIGGNYVHKKRL